MEHVSNSHEPEADWLLLTEVIDRVHSWPAIDEFDTLLREHRLRETTTISPPQGAAGICIHESMFAHSNLSGLFSESNVTIQGFSLVVDTFEQKDTIIHGQFLANGTPYTITQQADMILLTEDQSPEMPGFALEQSDIKQLLYVQIAQACDEQPDVLDSVLSCFSPTATEISSLHDTAIAYGNVLGKSTRTMSAAFNNEDNGRALIVQYSQTETPYQSEQSNQLDIGYLGTTQDYVSGELIAYERSVPDDEQQNTDIYRGVTAPTDMSPQEFIDHVRLHGTIDTFDALLGSQLYYPAIEQNGAIAYGKLCEELVAVVEPKLLEIASRPY